MKKPIFFTSASAMGDVLSSTPTIKKIAEIYQHPVLVVSNHNYLFKNNPYVDYTLEPENFNEEEFKDNYHIHKTFFFLGKSDPLGIEFKHAICDIRQFHAKDLGFLLTPDELSCDYFPDDFDLVMGQIELPEKYVVIHPSVTWGSRTWEMEKWQNLCDSLNKQGIPVVSIGKDSRENSDHLSQEKPIIPLRIENGLDLSNKTSLDQTWHILDKSACVITMDSGILHLAGTTNTHIIHLGSSIRSEFRAPYRKGSQSYKYDYVLGKCGIHCASDLKYSLRDWGHIQAVTLISTCLENKDSFECHPGSLEVLNKVLDAWEEFLPSDKEKRQIFPHLIKINSGSLGDTIGSLSAVEAYRKKNNVKVEVICKLDGSFFSKSYPNIEFHSHDSFPILDSNEKIWTLGGRKYSFFREIFYKFDRPLIKGYADQLAVDAWEDPKIDLFIGERPIKNKYVCFSMHSTAQSKHWNYPDGWDLLCRLLRKEGYTPVCIDRFESFGIEGHWNPVPQSCVKRQGMDLKEMINYIYHSEFFIGLSSGLSWVAHSVGKRVVLISGVTSENNEFEKNTLRIMNKSVCHGCINDPEITFDPGDWMWCPHHKNTDRQFECTRTISPEEVILRIKNHLSSTS